MKIGFVGEHVYKQYLDKLEFPKEIQTLLNVEDVYAKNFESIILVETIELTPSVLMRIREMNSTAKILFIQISESTKNQAVCAAHQIDIVQGDLTEERFKQFIEKLWFSIKTSLYKNVIALFGTHTQAGTSSTAFSIAHQILRKNRSVCLVNLNLYNPGEFPEKPSEYSLNTIYQALVGGQTDKIKGVMNEIDGVPVLIGNRNPTQVHVYEIEPLKRLIDYLREEYDYVVLDAGAIFDNAGSLVSMMCSGTKVLVATQQEISIRNFNRNYEFVLSKLNFDIETFHLIVNKYVASATYTPQFISESINVNLLGNIPYIYGAEDIELQHGYLISTGEKVYDKAIVGVVNGLMVEMDSTYSIQETKQKKFKLF